MARGNKLQEEILLSPPQFSQICSMEATHMQSLVVYILVNTSDPNTDFSQQPLIQFDFSTTQSDICRGCVNSTVCMINAIWTQKHINPSLEI